MADTERPQTAHFRLINAIARTCPTVEAAFAFHEQLFMSGFERVLFVRPALSVCVLVR